MKKNRFSCLIPQKNRLEKCSLEVKSVFENIDFWGTYGLRSIEKWPKSPNLLKMPIFRCFLVHKFPKNKYFQKPISLLNYIFQGGSFEVSNMKIYFFSSFFTKGSPLWFLKTLIENEKSTINVRKKIKTDLKSVGKTLSFAPCGDVLACPWPKIAIPGTTLLYSDCCNKV